MRRSPSLPGTAFAPLRTMFLKRSIGGHHVLARTALVVLVVLAVAACLALVYWVARGIGP
ncbi:MAG TPA: hypothetical protein VIM73_03665 [Polyangiaceae bacterium]